IFTASCSKDDDTKEAGTVEVEFDNIAVVNGIERQLSMVTPGSTDYGYTNGMGQNFNINLLRYYITNIKLEGPNGEVFNDHVHVEATGTEGVYLVDESVPSSSSVILKNVPAGQYNKITFTVGVEENAVTEGAAGGNLDPATCNMFWNWNSGYIALKFEGQSNVSAGGAGGETINGIEKGMAYHIGGWKEVEGTAFVYNNKTMSFNFDTNAKVEKGLQPAVHMVFDVLKLFAGQNMIDFTGNNNVHKPVDGKPAAENIPGAFAFDHIHQ
ncbi:MAG: MbnP family protein, partial [Saprospiraceae bacterium]